MSVIFGWYSFKLKSYTAEDLDLNEEEWGNSKFEIRQEIFHLFWLPLFGLGQSYGLRRDGDLLKLPEWIETKLEAKDIRTPWYSFFIPILIIVGLIGFGIFYGIADTVFKHQSYSGEKESYEASMIDVQNKLEVMETNSYLRLLNINKSKKDSVLFLKLLSQQDSIYNFELHKAIIPYYSREKYYWKKSTNIVRLKQSELDEFICMDYNEFKEKKCGSNFLDSTKTYIVDQIDFFDRPVIDGDINWDFWNPIRKRKFGYYNSRFTGHKSDRSWSFKLELQNYGIPVNLIQIQNIENELEWPDSLPIKFNSYEYLKNTYIEASTLSDPDTLQFKSKFIFEDSLKNKYEYIIKGNDASYEIFRN